jgi:sugar lactone lactonase YvrE
MAISDIVLGLAAGVGVRLSPDGKTAYYVEWSIGRLCKVEVQTGMVKTVMTGLSFPEDVLVDWDTNEIFVSERTGSVLQILPKRIQGRSSTAEWP